MPLSFGNTFVEPAPDILVLVMAAVIVATSLVARGRVGARATVFALERLGHEVWLVPTIILPFHPGHGPGITWRPSGEEFDGLVGDLIARPDFAAVDAVLTGYLGTPEQAATLARLIDGLKRSRDQARILVDPVIGDQGGLYVSDETAAGIRDHLIPRADIATPNRFELAWLTGLPVRDNREIMAAAATLGPATTLVTSAEPMLRAKAATLVRTVSETWLAEADHVANPPNGPGDLMAALYLAHVLGGRTAEEALRRSVASTHDILIAAARAGSDELPLVAAQQSLMTPRMPVSLRRLGSAK